MMKIASEARSLLRRRALRGHPQQAALQAIEDKKAIFFHVPKCGGKSIIHNFYGIDIHDWFGHARPEFYKSLLGARRFKTYFKFAILRDPLDRCQSAFHFAKSGGFGKARGLAFQKAHEDQSFDAFILGGGLEKYQRDYVVFQSQSSFIVDSSGKPTVDKTYQLDSLDVFYKEMGIAPQKAKHVNASKYQKQPVDPEVAARVRQVYEQDYVLLES